ncbi:histidinol-phosphate transaminase [Neobacillus notoginsengisoli]|uniref:Histidinol-phosphate aminotransferase n=1 Tax=Neobacillus notoginsengisoli TaxID=1578198 RepID=A0A417YVC1_9BACI|nr:histidinol-phosphate transaminase [Neobacillus notoginsengisoli]RHW41251.1 histidinol-phosphate transaminase [Neobacillus notoginsengisoli]
MRWKKQLHSLAPYQPGRSIESVKKEYGLKTIVKLASNENPFGCSQNVEAAIKKASIDFNYYPDGHAGELRSTLSQMLEVAPDQLIFGNGSDEIIRIISRALLYPGANTVMASPTFPQYRHNAVLEGADVREIPLVNGGHDLDAMLKAIDGQTNVVWICSPNNPTGVHIPDGFLTAFLQKVPEDVLVVIDEAYCEYVTAADFHDSLALVNQFSNVIALRTFSKIYGLASLRVGYGIANPAIIRMLEPAREPFNTNTIAHIAAKAALADLEFVERAKRLNRKGMEMFYEFCRKWNLPFYPSQGNFILINFKQEANKVFQSMLERGFIVRSGALLGFPDSIRVTVGTEEQVAAIINEFEAFLVNECKAIV